MCERFTQRKAHNSELLNSSNYPLGLLKIDESALNSIETVIFQKETPLTCLQHWAFRELKFGQWIHFIDNLES
jgi:hypothetical protein